MESKPLKILAIDDILDNLISVKALVLEAFPDAKVIMAQSGHLALELAQTEDPDLVLLDIVMPGMDGFEVCRRLKLDPLLQDIPVVFVTALKGDRDSRIKALEVGAEAFLAKPIDEIELVAQIRAMVKIKKANIQRRHENQKLAELVSLRTSELMEQLEERKRAEKQLIEQELQYHTLADSGQALVRTFNIYTQAIFFNVPWLKFTGRALDAELGEGWLKGIYNEDVENYKEAFLQGFSKQSSFELEFRLQSANGTYRWIHEFASPNYDSHQNFVGYISHCFDVTDNRKVEEKLNLQSLVLNQIHDCVIVTDLKGVIVDANESEVNLLGYSREELLGSTIFMFGEDAKKGATQNEILGETLSVGLWKGEVVNRTKDGREIILNVRTQMVYDQTKKPIALCGISTDITMQKEAEAMFKTLQQAVEQSPVSVVITDPRGIIEYVNPKFCQVTGYTASEALGQNPKILKSEGQPESIYKELWDCITSGNTWHGEFKNKKKNGEIYWESATISSILDTKGDIIHFLAVKEDITQQKHHQLIQQTQYNIARAAIQADHIREFLEKVRLELNELLDATNFLVAIYNVENDTLQALHMKDEMDDFKEWRAEKSLSGKVVKEGQTICLHEQEIKDFLVSNGLEMIGTPCLAWVGVPITLYGQVAGVLVVQSYSSAEAYSSSDVSLLQMVAHETGLFIEKHRMIEDLISAKEKARESDRLKTAFINNISHEIRTPLNGIQGFGQLMTEPDLSEEERKSYYKSVEESSTRLIQTVTDYMDMALLAAGSMPVNLNQVYFVSEVEDVIETYRTKCLAKKLGFNVDFGGIPDDFVFMFDKELLGKILGHLLSNSVKFTSQGFISVVCTIYNDQLEIRVKDTGKGIGLAKQQVVFDAFIQEDISTTRGHEGSGLGLAIVKRVVELLNGSIRLISDKGEGAEFILTFSIHVPGETQSDKAKPIQRLRQEVAADPLILVAEDDEDNYYYIQVLLDRMGYKYLRVDNGEDAVKMCFNNPDIALVLMDIKMPLMNGVEATRLIRTKCADLPVIAITAYAQTGDEFKILQAGCNDYISKPIQKMELQTKIFKHLHISKISD